MTMGGGDFVIKILTQIFYPILNRTGILIFERWGTTTSCAMTQGLGVRS